MALSIRCFFIPRKISINEAVYTSCSQSLTSYYMAKSFAELYYGLSDTSRSADKITLLAEYLSGVSPHEFGWSVHLLCGGTCKVPIRTKQLREWVIEMVGIPGWLLEESYGVVGDLAETLAIIVAGSETGKERDSSVSSLVSWIEVIQGLARREQSERKAVIQELWRSLSQDELLVFNKLLTGGLRVGVSKGLLARALAQVCGVGYEAIWQRLAGDWTPEQMRLEFFEEEKNSRDSISPYPFFLAHQLDRETTECGSSDEWQIEWKWDGIRAQVVRRGDLVAVWSRGDELITESFPELVRAAQQLPSGTVLDGEIVAWIDGRVGSFFDLQKRLNRKKVTSTVLKSIPVRFFAYDVLEYQGLDQREVCLGERSALLRTLEPLLDDSHGIMSVPNTLLVASWDEVTELRQSARAHNAEGLMLKRLDSRYGVGRTAKGAWWKWKLDPFSIDAVLLYAQKGHGRRADLYTDYTFGVWDGDTLVTFTKAYSGLTDKELMEIDSFVKRNTMERFGPVRTVKPELVFEIGFEAIQRSSRHRSGVAVRFPRILRWRRDKPASEADIIEALRGLLS